MTRYVSIAETMPLDVLPEFMNKYFALNFDEIIKRNGIIDKFEGDKIIAFWGRFESAKESAQRACESALAQMDAMNQFYDWAKRNGHPCPEIRIGISAGELIVGNLGSSSRIDYTVMGHDVNVAFALQEAAKEFGSCILVSESTCSLTNGLEFGDIISIDCCNSKINAHPLIQ